MNKFLSSANGFRLQVTNAGQVFDLYASWAAPFFVVPSFDASRDESPSLHHCDDLQHARDIARYGGQIFNAQFELVGS